MFDGVSARLYRIGDALLSLRVDRRDPSGLPGLMRGRSHLLDSELWRPGFVVPKPVDAPSSKQLDEIGPLFQLLSSGPTGFYRAVHLDAKSVTVAACHHDHGAAAEHTRASDNSFLDGITEGKGHSTGAAAIADRCGAATERIGSVPGCPHGRLRERFASSNLLRLRLRAVPDHVDVSVNKARQDGHIPEVFQLRIDWYLCAGHNPADPVPVDQDRYVVPYRASKAVKQPSCA